MGLIWAPLSFPTGDTAISTPVVPNRKPVINRRSRNVGYGPAGDTAGSDSCQAEDPARSDFLHRVTNHRSDTGTLDDDVRLESEIQNPAGVICRAEGTHEVGLRSGFDTIEDMDLVFPQFRHAGRQETNRTRAGHQHRFRFPEEALSHRENLLQCFHDDRRRLEKYAENSQGRVYLDRVFGFDPPPFGHVTVNLFDAPLGVLAVAAHVPLTHRTIGAGNRVGTQDNSRHEIPFFKSGGRPGIDHAAERFVPQHEPGLARRRPAVFSFHNFDIGSTDSDGDRFHKHRAVP
jgi:hypothetical protein